MGDKIRFTVFCPNCSGENREIARYCIHCGISLIEEVTPVFPSKVEIDKHAVNQPEPEEVEVILIEAAQSDEEVEEPLIEVDQPDEDVEEPEPEEVEVPLIEVAQSNEEVDDPEPEDDTLELDMEDEEQQTEEENNIVEAGEEKDSSTAPTVTMDAFYEEPDEVEGADISENPTVVDLDARQMAEMLEPEEIEDDTLQLKRDSGLLHIAEGTIIDGRYEVKESHLSEDDKLSLVVEDHFRCPDCYFENSSPDNSRCSNCGAEIPYGALVEIDQVPDGEEGSIVIGNRQFHIRTNQGEDVDVEETVSSCFRLVHGFHSDVGMIRQKDEDSLLVISMAQMIEGNGESVWGFYAVADGIGGHDAGEIASRIIVNYLSAELLEKIITPMIRGKKFSEAEIQEELKEMVVEANKAVLMERLNSGLDMGSTFTGLFILGDSGFVLNVGDSRTYLLRNKELLQLTRDHSLVARWVEQGKIEPEEIYTHAEKGIIYRSLGDVVKLEVDCSVIEVKADDRFLICCDGLWEMVRDEELEKILLDQMQPFETSILMVDRANDAGGEDNISVIVVDVNSWS